MATKSFPVRPAPESGEIFSSWAARVAFAHGMSLNGLLTYLYSDCKFCKRDIDKYTYLWVINRLADATKVDIASAQNTSLVLHVQPISNIERHPHRAEWVTHVGNIYNRARTFGMCFCPICLSEDEVPHFRLKWRLSFVTMCPKHKTLLNNKCPACKQEISIYRLSAHAEELAKCCWCRYDLKKSTCFQSHLLSQYLPLQHLMETLLDKLQCPTITDYSSIREDFGKLYHLAYLVMHAVPKDLEKYQKILLELESQAFCLEPYKTFDMYEPINRQIVLRIAYALLQVDTPCNLTRYLDMQAKGFLKNFHQVMRLPCGKWCKNHDYLKISKTCNKWLGSFIS